MNDRPTLLLTRPRAQAERFADECRVAFGDLRVVISPTLTIRYLEPPSLEGLAGVLLSSEHGARALGDGDGLRAWCVGDRTAEVARECGFDAVSAGGSAEELVAMVAAAAPEGRLLHAHGAHTRGDVAGRLRAAGLTVGSVEVYEQEPAELSVAAREALAAGDVVLPIFSPRSAGLLARTVAGSRAVLRPVALSPAVAAAWSEFRPEIPLVAETLDAQGMLGALATIYTPSLT